MSTISRPIYVLGVAQLVAQLGELDDVGLGGLRLAGARGPERAGKVRDRHDEVEGARPDRQLCCAVPVAALDRIARRRGRQRIVGAQDAGFEIGFLHHVVHDVARLLVLRELQVGIGHVILGVQIIADRFFRLRRLHRGDVGIDRLLPVADAGVDV